MVRVPSTQTLKIGSEAPDFALPSMNGFSNIRFADYRGKKGYLVIFTCNHCPFVLHVADKLTEVVNAYQKKGIAAFAINCNDPEKHPEDGPDKMGEEAKKRGFEFPYLYDETQSVAKAYFAACTPDFFLFDENKKLYYRGQMDDARPSNDVPVTGSDLVNAMKNLLEGNPSPEKQMPSLGCNIKWKAGNEPSYFNSPD